MEGEIYAGYNLWHNLVVPELDEQDNVYPNDFEAVGGV
jgi:hypothetical protein